MMRILRKGDSYALHKPLLQRSYPSLYSRRLVCLLALLFFIKFSCYAQESRASGATGFSQEEIKPLVFGRQVPDDFWSREHLFYIQGDTVRKTLQEYKGKALILDFWATWCGGCIANLKKAERVQKLLSSELNVLLVNGAYTKDSLEKIDQMHQKTIPSKWEGSIPTVIYDDYLQNLFPHFSVPCYVWLSKGGVLKALTVASFLGVGEAANYLNY